MGENEQLTMVLTNANAIGDKDGSPILDRIAETERPTAKVMAKETVLNSLNEFIRQQSNQELVTEMRRILSRPYNVLTSGKVMDPNRKLAEYMGQTIEDSSLGKVLPFYLNDLTVQGV